MNSVNTSFLTSITHPKTVLLLPIMFLFGYLINDHLVTSAEVRLLEAERVAKRLGEWAPPALSEAERATLVAERARCAQDIAQLTARLQAAARPGGVMGAGNKQNQAPNVFCEKRAPK